ncbi:MAG: molecular chaperone [Nitrospiria bacterium]
MQYPTPMPAAQRFIVFKALAIALFLFPVTVTAGQFTVSPIKLQFDQRSRSGAIHVFNEEKKPLKVQIKAYEWSQDTKGKDRYTETKDILFFPKITTVHPNKDRIIRVGIQGPFNQQEKTNRQQEKTNRQQEKTYRLFIEEIPDKTAVEAQTQINVAIRFGVPIFVEAEKKQIAGKVAQISLREGQLRMSILNEGNTHFVIQSIRVRGIQSNGQEHYSKEISGWYLLNGSRRAYATHVPPDICRQTTAFNVEVKTNEFSLHEKLNVDQNLCTQ